MAETTATPATSTVTELLFLHAQTSLHPGSGTALGVVDLPIQRERHTQWPIIPGSSLKGILRDACRRKGNDEDVITAFGPDTANADKHAGALSVTDARILAFPVRSLRGVFAWVTCKAVLTRLNRDLKLAHFQKEVAVDFTLEAEQAICTENSPLLLENNTKLVLEEFEFKRLANKPNATAEWIATHAVSDGSTGDRIRSCLVILNDDDFTHFVRHATEIMARIGLDYEKKTVREGALFYQECLPPETLFYSLVFANDSRKQGHKKKAREIMDYLQSYLPSVLQVGGDETTGKGLCAVKLSNNNGGAQ